MSFRHSTQTIPRVSANSIGSPRSATEQATSSFQIGVESVSLALTRHGVVVLKLRHDDAACLQALQDAAATHFAAQQHPLTPSAPGGHIVLPGCSSLDYRPGSMGCAALPHSVQAAAHQVTSSVEDSNCCSIVPLRDDSTMHFACYLIASTPDAEQQSHDALASPAFKFDALNCRQPCLCLHSPHTI